MSLVCPLHPFQHPFFSRLDSSCVTDGPINRHLGTYLNRWHEAWFSQANHIFTKYLITPSHEKCCKCKHLQKDAVPYFLVTALVWGILYQLQLSPTPGTPPEGYLFLCPLEDLQSEEGAFTERPKCFAYWSLDSSGSERLRPEEASALGFPSLRWTRRILCRSWPESVYVGLSQFHAAKGFNVNSQDIARHLGHPLYEISRDPSSDFARSKHHSIRSILCAP